MQEQIQKTIDPAKFSTASEHLKVKAEQIATPRRTGMSETVAERKPRYAPKPLALMIRRAIIQMRGSV